MGQNKDVEQYIKSCHLCQWCKNPYKKYRDKYLKDMDQNPWDTIGVDLIGPFKVTKKYDNPQIPCESTSPRPGERWWDNERVFRNLGQVQVLKSHILGFEWFFHLWINSLSEVVARQTINAG
jgi:hypothetical protein